MLLTVLTLFLVSGDADGGQKSEPVVCQTVADCWLDANGRAIARPRGKRGHKLPGGNCTDRLVWLRHRLSCEQHRCVSLFVGDKC